MQIGKDIERYDWYYNRELISEVIIDRQNKEEYRNSTRICDLLNQQDQRISELEEQLNSAQVGEQFALKCCKEAEEQLKNAIVPKFKIGQEVWFIYDESDDCDYTILNKKVMAYTYNNYEGDYFEYAMSDDGTRDTIWYGYVEEKYVFATKEEAQAKLKELKGE